MTTYAPVGKFARNPAGTRPGTGASLGEITLFKLDVGSLLSGIGSSEADADAVAAFQNEARRAGLERSTMERLNRVYEERAIARQRRDQDKALEVTQGAFDQSIESQREIMSFGRSGLREVLRNTTVVGVIALVAFAATRILVARADPDFKERGDDKKGRSKSKSKRTFRGKFSSR